MKSEKEPPREWQQENENGQQIHMVMKVNSNRNKPNSYNNLCVNICIDWNGRKEQTNINLLFTYFFALAVVSHRSLHLVTHDRCICLINLQIFLLALSINCSLFLYWLLSLFIIGLERERESSKWRTKKMHTYIQSLINRSSNKITNGPFSKTTKHQHQERKGHSKRAIKTHVCIKFEL